MPNLNNLTNQDTTIVDTDKVAGSVAAGGSANWQFSTLWTYITSKLDSSGTLPVPADPADDGKVLTANSGVTAWAAASDGALTALVQSLSPAVQGRTIDIETRLAFNKLIRDSKTTYDATFTEGTEGASSSAFQTGLDNAGVGAKIFVSAGEYRIGSCEPLYGQQIICEKSGATRLVTFNGSVALSTDTADWTDNGDGTWTSSATFAVNSQQDHGTSYDGYPNASHTQDVYWDDAPLKNVALASTTIATSEAGGQSVLTVVDASEFSIGQRVTIVLDAGTHETTITDIDYDPGTPVDITVADPLPSISTGGAVTARPGTGQFYFSVTGGPNTVMLGDSPAGATSLDFGVERDLFIGNGAPTSFIAGDNKNVYISGCIVEKYATLAQMGAIGGQFPPEGWHVEDCIIRLNHGTGYTIPSFGSLIDSEVYSNGCAAGGTGTSTDSGHPLRQDIYIKGNKLHTNGYAGYSDGWTGGAIKAASVLRLTYLQNYVYDNRGRGLWTDGDCVDTLYDQNVIYNNGWEGIFHEISMDCVIRRNKVGKNGTKQVYPHLNGIQEQPDYGANILIADSKNVDIYSNIVEVGDGFGLGIILKASNRKDGSRPTFMSYGGNRNYLYPYLLSNCNVYSNDIAYLGDTPVAQNNTPHSGISATTGWPTVYTPLKTCFFNRNRYHCVDTAVAHFKHKNPNGFSSVWNFLNWQSNTVEWQKGNPGVLADGQDPNSTIDTSWTPLSWSPTMDFID